MALSPLGLLLLFLVCWTLLPGPSGEESLSLLGARNHCEGLLQVQYLKQKGPMCADHWDMKAASVTCRQLDCGPVFSSLKYVVRSRELEVPWLNGVHCHGDEASLWECSLGAWEYQSSCECRCVVVMTCSGGTLQQIGLGGGGSPCAGIPEVVNPAGFVLRCELYKEEATVFCTELGCGTALQWSSVYPGMDREDHWQKFVSCQGTESSIFNCKINMNFLEQCDLSTYTEVVCSGHIEARLVGGAHPCTGRLEVRQGLTWGTICDSNLDLTTAHVVCRELRCGVAVSMHGGAHFSQGSGIVWNEAFRCMGNESLLFYCPREPGHQCGHSQDAGLTCSGEKCRLVNGSNSCEGHVEVHVQGTWAPVCATHWDLADATVLCHQLNCGNVVAIPQGGHFGEGEGPIWPDVFHCVGTEPHLLSCPASTLGAPACAQGNMASAICSGRPHALRLRDGQSHCDGRVEIFLGDVWGRVLDDAWDLRGAQVVCRQLGCGLAERAYDAPFTDLRLQNYSQPCAGRLEVFYNGTWGGVCQSLSAASLGVLCEQLGCGPQGQLQARVGSWPLPGALWVASIQCRARHDRTLWQCPSAPWNQHSCSSQEEAWVICAEKTDVPQDLEQTINCSSTNSCPEEGALRLRGGEDHCSGRVELWHTGSWGTVCDDSWDLADAEVVCRQLGCGQAENALGSAAFSPGSGPIWLDEVGCRGSEETLWDCPAQPWGRGDCTHKEDAGVRCSGEPRLSLCPTGPSLVPPPVHKAWTLPETACLILGSLLCIISLFLGAQWCHRKAACMGSVLSETPSEGVYEDIGAVFMGVKDTRAALPGDPVLEEEYDDVG
ncbi:scavenger receptor cysteine-rich domain-containing protein SCART1 [Tupaia chinensis]|uniref:scavenger receptor cysteine-rich domain-containing protein SCART1 n=1 Tax=Tupaia chinensis TaxID=246437 RepID=UPI000FFB1AAD|nr:scavenger receptor cysteine-rich domain-containing protein SCART1 [Tupaia chinensis]